MRFQAWLNELRDAGAVARIVARIRRFELGNAGDCKALGAGLMEMRIDHGPGYRVYYVQRGETVVILLCGGNKRKQRKDIARARTLVAKV